MTSSSINIAHSIFLVWLLQAGHCLTAWSDATLHLLHSMMTCVTGVKLLELLSIPFGIFLKKFDHAEMSTATMLVADGSSDVYAHNPTTTSDQASWLRFCCGCFD
jgi:hypothetical protein